MIAANIGIFDSLDQIFSVLKKNKMIFSKLIGEKYKIKKDLYDKHTLTIQSNDKEVKCKCIMFMIEKELNKNTNNNDNNLAATE